MDLPICGPTIVYVAFSTTQIIVDLYRGLYNTSFIKALVTGLIALTLQVLCNMNLSMVAWMIVFIPFITMTIFTALLLFVFGVSSIKGDASDYRVQYPNSATTQADNSGKPISSPSVAPKQSSGLQPLVVSSVNEKGTLYTSPAADGIENLSSLSNAEGFKNKLDTNLARWKRLSSGI